MFLLVGSQVFFRHGSHNSIMTARLLCRTNIFPTLVAVYRIASMTGLHDSLLVAGGSVKGRAGRNSALSSYGVEVYLHVTFRCLRTCVPTCTLSVYSLAFGYLQVDKQVCVVVACCSWTLAGGACTVRGSSPCPSACGEAEAHAVSATTSSTTSRR